MEKSQNVGTKSAFMPKKKKKKNPKIHHLKKKKNPSNTLKNIKHRVKINPTS